MGTLKANISGVGSREVLDGHIRNVGSSNVEVRRASHSDVTSDAQIPFTGKKSCNIAPEVMSQSLQGKSHVIYHRK